MYQGRLSFTVLVILHSAHTLAPALNDTLSGGDVSPTKDTNASGIVT